MIGNVDADPAGELIAIGRVGPAHGVRGAVFVAPWTDDLEERFAAGAVLRTDPDAVGPLTVASAWLHNERLIVQFVGITDRASAQALRGARLLISAADRPVLDDPNEFYDSDLVGLAAVTPEGDELGPVRDVVHVPGRDYLVLEVGGRDRLVPFVAAIVPRVDMASGTVLIDPPEGLFDL
jgi:16S rRNA processing protein RimM